MTTLTQLITDKSAISWGSWVPSLPTVLGFNGKVSPCGLPIAGRPSESRPEFRELHPCNLASEGNVRNGGYCIVTRKLRHGILNLTSTAFPLQEHPCGHFLQQHGKPWLPGDLLRYTGDETFVRIDSGVALSLTFFPIGSNRLIDCTTT